MDRVIRDEAMEKQMMYLVIKETANRADIWETGDQNHWTWLDEIEQKEGTPYEIIWAAEDDRVRVHYIEDYLTGVSYFIVESSAAGREELEIVMEQIRSRMAVYNRQEILAGLDGALNDDQLTQALYRAGIAAPAEYDDGFYRAFQTALADPSPAVRMAAIEAASYITWEEIKQLIAKVHQTDADKAVREQAGVLLEVYRKFP